MSRSQLEIEYQNRNPEGHFFDPQTMRFFQSRIQHSTTETHDRDIYFITSERCGYGDNPRLYTPRRLKADGNIDTIGEFNTLTLHQAKKLLKETIESRKAAAV